MKKEAVILPIKMAQAPPFCFTMGGWFIIKNRAYLDRVLLVHPGLRGDEIQVGPAAFNLLFLTKQEKLGVFILVALP